jgi:hypothetical protein
MIEGRYQTLFFETEHDTNKIYVVHVHKKNYVVQYGKLPDNNIPKDQLY